MQDGTKKEKNSRQLQAEITEKKIWEESIRLIASRPISDIKIQDITNACDISKGAFYHYFSSKEELFAKITLEPGRDISESIRFSSGSLKRLRDFIIWRLGEAEENGLSYTRNLQGFRLVDTYRKLRDEWFDSQHYEYNLMMEIFTDAVNNGQLSDEFPASMIAQTIVYLVHGAIYNQCLYDEELNLVSWGEQFCDFLEQVMLKPYLLT
ncbi:hypothetical protein F220043C3_32750 [Enterocloster asparagiformis]|uniref:TetR/AcrR family transcriptional regulator n=1 Tax=Enterocloster asparagiformis TaxID=333367 RepID=UPI0034B5F41C